jgi:hypothetical protein
MWEFNLTAFPLRGQYLIWLYIILYDEKKMVTRKYIVWSVYTANVRIFKDKFHFLNTRSEYFIFKEQIYFR